MGDFFRSLPQYLLPHHGLSRLVHAATRSRSPWLRGWLLGRFLDRFEVNLDEAERTDPADYQSFNDFFTRTLKHGARPIEDAPLVSPVDGYVSQQGDINGQKIFQAKGRQYRLDELLGRNCNIRGYRDGRFCTLYLAPHNYHRIHMPLAGRVSQIEHLPGRLFSVNPATTRVIPRLFARNERVAVHFETDYGPMAMVLIGALLVGSIETTWTGEITPPTRLSPRILPLPPGPSRQLAKGQEMGRFNMGSTVILILPTGAPNISRRLHPGARVQMGQSLVE
ncbi:phosphatidylserine decarboxylase [Natronospira proteinivora]|uniref:Phosphatidylserine decarboxylase proenzyme n=1 Tax=Natronospira proteinivora TaxID=1807133 RepID=A0ABT1G744_9GAMM|nr:archaetidylserine decarboxylase [Natronospira proteinivora]MCP1727112.1 phosphatidylserine decarboxylase [Natronospira proteinivora]